VNIPGTDEFIYSWHPLRIGKICEDKFYFLKEIETPPVFSLFRGSAPPILIDNVWWTLVHFVEYCQPRKYYHCIVQLEEKSFRVLKVSLPFVFESIGIEFCISGRLYKNSLEYYFSSWDKNSSKVTIPLTNFQWISIGEPEINNIVRVPSNLKVYWAGGYSKCFAGGSIERYVNKSINNQKLNISAIFSLSDGIVEKTEFNNIQKSLGYPLSANTCELDYYTLFSRALKNTVPIICMLCSRNFSKPELLLLPLDDETFERGLTKVLSHIPSPVWNDRKSIVFWRGGTSGFDRPQSLRMKVTEFLINNRLTNVRITRGGYPINEINIPEEHFGERCDLQTHFQYKYILIIDGNLIASNHQWVFGSGSVPIMITHPQNNWWFKKFLKPMENYVPINYDLSNLEEKIEWLIQNDGEAQKIATNALEFSNRIFSPEFQQKYIDEEICSLYGNPKNIEMLETGYIRHSTVYSDIFEHLPTLREYASKCSSVVECGVRSVVSSYAFATGLKNNQPNSFTLVDPYKSDQIEPFLSMCKAEGVNASFLEQSDLNCPLVETDLLFIDTWHVYAQLKRELAYWHNSVKKYIIMHDTTVDEWQGETVRSRSNGVKETQESGFPHCEIMRGLWPAIEEFLQDHPEWKIEKRFVNNNGLTILARV